MKFICEEHSTILRAILSMGGEEPLPGRVAEVYWQAKAASERINMGLTHHDLLFIVMHSFIRPPDNPDPSFFDMARAGQIESDTKVEVRWKNKWRAGRYKSVSGNDGISVWIDDGTGMDRILTPDRVRLPS